MRRGKYINPERQMKNRMGDNKYYEMLQHQADNNRVDTPPMFRPLGFYGLKFLRGKF